MNSITQTFRSKLFAGIATLLPLYLTFIVIKFLFTTLDIGGVFLVRQRVWDFFKGWYDDGWYDGGEDQTCNQGCAAVGLVCTAQGFFAHNSDVDT